MRVSLVTLFTVLLIVGFANVASAQGCDSPPTICAKCQDKDPEKPLYCKTTACSTKTPTGSASGFCTTPCKCGASSFSDQGGKSQGVGDLKGILDAVKGIMDALKGKGGGGGGEQPPQDQLGEDQQCTSYYQVTAPSTDKCAYYVPPVSDSLLGDTSGLGSGASNALLEALEGGSALNVSDQLFGAIQAPQESETGEPQQGGTTQTQTSTGTATGGGLSGQAVSLQGGTQGDIRLTPTGATVVASARDEQANTEVAGFYGSSGGQPQGLVASMCQSRPWAGSIVSYVIPPSFFDSLCVWRGYQVGTPEPSPPPSIVQQTLTSPSSAAPATTTPTITIAPEVEIWAVPDRVPLGSRTTIFWNTKGVDSCTVTSPEGNFEEHALSGGAATVPLSGATTFSISCLAPTGEPVSDFVTVNLTI